MDWWDEKLKIPDSVSNAILQYLQTQNLGRLLEGDILTGRVISVDMDLLLMQLLDGSKISAQISPGTSYNPGDILKLKVIDIQQGKVITTEVEHYPVQNGEVVVTSEETGYHPVQNNVFIATDPERQVQSNAFNVHNEKANNPADILKALNLPAGKLHIDIVNTIIGMGKKPTAEIIQKAFNIIGKMQIEDPKHAVFLILNGLEGEEEYIPVLKELDAGKFHFAEELDNLIDLLDASGDENLSFFSERIRSIFINSLVKTFAHEKSTEQHIGAFKREKSPVHPEIAFDKETSQEKEPEQHRITLDIKSLKPKEIALPKADKWISEVKKELSVLSKLIQNSTAGNKEKIMSAVDRLDTAIRLFNELQGFEMFVQIPLILKENRQTNGELYIMKRAGKKGKLNSNDFTIFLSLSTDNIGDLDIFVHVRNKNVMIKVFAEDVKYNQLFMDEYKSLYNDLKEKGYKLFDLDFELKDEKVNIFNAEKKTLTYLDTKTKIDIKV